MTPLEMLIGLLVVFIVTEGLKSLSALLHMELTGFGSAIAASLTGLVVAIVMGYVGTLPAQYVPVIQSVAVVLLTILGSFGIHRTSVRIFGFVPSKGKSAKNTTQKE
jgi:hypothetical protein